MIISNKHKYIYVAVPKTGTTSIQKFLLTNDPTATKNSITLGEEFIKFREHMHTSGIHQILGDHAKEFQTIAFMRHPFSRMLSGHSFYKNGGKYWLGTEKRSLLRRCQISFARFLPFKVWAFLYPYKSNIEYFFDEYDNMIVDKIGVFEDLKKDIKQIFDSLHLEFDYEKLDHLNKSNHGAVNIYFNKKWYVDLLKFRHPKLRKDIDFYNEQSKKKEEQRF